MAIARMTCGQCGSVLSSPERVCPACGADIELPLVSTPGNEVASPARCSACGHQNVNPGAFCESCCVPLPGHRASGAKRSRELESAGTSERKGRQPRHKDKRKRFSS